MKKYFNSKCGFLILNVAFSILLPGCGILKESPKYQFNEGYYHSRIYHKKNKKVYIVPGDDSIKIYAAKALKNQHVDSISSLKLAFPAGKKPAAFGNYIFKRNTFDADVLTVLFKFRPSVKGFPPQLNATFNAALYFGYRADVYRLSYKETPLKIFKRNINHYGFSAGLFSGFGTARIDEYVTQNAIDIQYDGVVNLTGIAAIIAFDKLSFGITAGADYLLDHNRRYWVNEGKPWFGISVGLNLN